MHIELEELSDQERELLKAARTNGGQLALFAKADTRGPAVRTKLRAFHDPHHRDIAESVRAGPPPSGGIAIAPLRNARAIPAHQPRLGIRPKSVRKGVRSRVEPERTTNCATAPRSYIHIHRSHFLLDVPPNQQAVFDVERFAALEADRNRAVVEIERAMPLDLPGIRPQLRPQLPTIGMRRPNRRSASLRSTPP